jgi:serine/threonine-protein kinase
MSAAASLTGATLGRYKLTERLGQGGMATVYRAVDPMLGREVAVKVLHPFVAERAEASQRFEREARAVAGLRHPNVLAVYDYQPAAGDAPAYLVMELLSGPSLRGFVEQHGTPLCEVGAMVGLLTARALGAAHARGLVHRDVKPENVMLDGARVVLCDFGLARMALAEGVTASGTLLGSPAYMSPEQAAGAEIDARSDLFSLGSLLYQLATGALPFAAAQPLAVLARIAAGAHAPPSAKNARVPRWLEQVIERCLMVDRGARFASAEAVAAALEAGLAADGLREPEAELASYLRDPPEYNLRLGARLVAASLREAQSAAERGQHARALAAAGRVLAWEPRHAEALALVDTLGRRRRTRRWLAAAAAVALALAAPAILLRRSTAPPATATVGKAEAAAGAGAAAAVVAEAATARAPQKSAPARAKPRPSARPDRAVAEADEPVSPVEPAAAPPPAAVPSDAELTVAIAPWCDLTVDGTPRGRTPQRLLLAPGAHHVECKNPVSGASLAREVTLEPGAHQLLQERLYAPARLDARLARGDSFSVDGDAPGAGPREVEPGRRRVTVYVGGHALETGYVDVPPGGCRLVDTPELACVRERP